MGFLIGSLVTVALGPLLFRWAGKRQASFAALDGFIMVTVAALVLAHILPDAVIAAGPLALALAVFGFMGPTWAESALRKAARQAHWVAVIVALTGVVGHSVLDGVALREEAFHSQATALAVVLHGLPVGVTIWWLLRPTMGAFFAGFVLALQCAATVVGYVVAPSLAHTLSDGWIGGLQAVVGGALLHVVLHRPPPMESPVQNPLSRRADGIGAVVGIVFAVIVFNQEAHEHAHGVGATFVDLALESAPALLVAFLLAGIVQTFLPSAPLRWMQTGRPASESLRGMIFGVPLAICSCGVVPLYQTLVSRAVPTTAAMAFLVATPELGIDSILISVPLLGGELTAFRFAAAAVMAFLIGWLVGRMVKPTQAVLPTPDAPKLTFRQRIKHGLHYSLMELVDHVGPWLVAGLALAALIAPILSAPWLKQLPWGVDVVVFTLLGMPAYVCASGATPLAAVLIAGGVSPGAAIAFLLSGPGTNVTTFGVLAKLHGRRVAVAFGAAMGMLGVAIGLAVNLLVEGGKLSVPVMEHSHGSILQIACLCALAIIFAASILRQGPRGFVGQVLSPYAPAGLGGHDHDHDHDHGHGHGHDHHGHSH